MSGASATASILVALNADGSLPSRIMLLPAGALATNDGRGPWRVDDPAKLAATSLPAGSKLPIDENHSTDLAAPQGRPSPAVAWITALSATPEGIFGDVEWNESGKRLMADRAYRGISPVFVTDKSGVVTRILRAALTNTPNLPALPALNSEETMDELLKKLRAALGLKDDANQDAVLNAVATLKSSTALATIAKAAGLKDNADAPAICTAVTAFASALAPIAKAAGLAETATATEICSAVTTLAAGNKDGKTVVALQAELAEVTTKLNALTSSTATERATAYVDGEIKKGRVGVKALRDHYISMHAADPARVEKEIGAMPILGPSGARVDPPADANGKVVLNADQLNAARLLGISPEAYLKTVEAEQAKRNAA